MSTVQPHDGRQMIVLRGLNLPRLIRSAHLVLPLWFYYSTSETPWNQLGFALPSSHPQRAPHARLGSAASNSCSRHLSPLTMTDATPAASAGDFVRRYDPEIDAKTVNMLVGQGVMEGLALANQRGGQGPPSEMLTLQFRVTRWSSSSGFRSAPR
jgi:hypothetical protein